MKSSSERMESEFLVIIPSWALISSRRLEMPVFLKIKSFSDMENLERYLNGKKLKNIVRLKDGY